MLMAINVYTTDGVLAAIGEFKDADSKFWKVAAYHSADENESIKAEKDLKNAANRLMKSLLDLVIEK